MFIFQCKELTPKIALLEERLKHYKDDVSPVDVLENLLCLSEEDRKDILWCASKKGNRRALQKLIKLLADKDKGFDQFVVALRKAKLKHVVLLLDPQEKGKFVFLKFKFLLTLFASFLAVLISWKIKDSCIQ